MHSGMGVRETVKVLADGVWTGRVQEIVRPLSRRKLKQLAPGLHSERRGRWARHRRPVRVTFWDRVLRTAAQARDNRERAAKEQAVLADLKQKREQWAREERPAVPKGETFFERARGFTRRLFGRKS